MANGLSVLGEQRDVICRQQRQRPFAKLSTKQRSREGANSHPHRQMGARPISGLAGGEELAGSLDIQAALDLGTGGSLGAELEGWRRESPDMEQRVGNASFPPLQMLWELRGAQQQGPTAPAPGSERALKVGS